MADNTIKALSLWQPWASAIALGLKRIETRGWTTRYRGPLLIHAAKAYPPVAREFHFEERMMGRLPERLPFGGFVAITLLNDVRAVDRLWGTLAEIEERYGDYSDGRYGLMLDGIFAFSDLVPYRGAQGFFDVPQSVVADAIAGATRVVPHPAAQFRRLTGA